MLSPPYYVPMTTFHHLQIIVLWCNKEIKIHSFILSNCLLICNKSVLWMKYFELLHTGNFEKLIRINNIIQRSHFHCITLSFSDEKGGKEIKIRNTVISSACDQLCMRSAAWKSRQVDLFMAAQEINMMHVYK